MKQPNKVKKQPDLKRRLKQITPTQESDVTVTVTLPAAIYRAIEALAGSDLEGWVRGVITDAVASEIATDELRDDDLR